MLLPQIELADVRRERALRASHGHRGTTPLTSSAWYPTSIVDSPPRSPCSLVSLKLDLFSEISKSDSGYGEDVEISRRERLGRVATALKNISGSDWAEEREEREERDRARRESEESERRCAGTVGMSGMRVGALGRGTRRERGGETMSASACSRALRVAGGRPTRRVTSSRRLRAYDNSREGGQQDDSSADYGRERGEDLEEQRALDELRSEFAQVVKQVRTFSSAWQPAGCATHGERSDVAFYFSAQPYFIFDDDGLTPSFDPTFSLSHTLSLSLFHSNPPTTPWNHVRRRPCPQNWDGLQLQGKDELSERYQDEFGVEIWLEKDIPEEPKEEAEELFDWWNDLDDVYVLIFQLHSDEDGIFTLKDSSASSEEEDSNNNFILSFESAEEAASYAVKLSDSLQGLKAEIECMERDELLQVSSRWRNGTRMRRQLPLLTLSLFLSLLAAVQGARGGDQDRPGGRGGAGHPVLRPCGRARGHQAEPRVPAPP